MQAFFTASQVGLIITGVIEQLTSVEFDNAGCDAAGESPIVADEDQGCRQSFQELFKPENRIDVEVVGRLIE